MKIIHIEILLEGETTHSEDNTHTKEIVRCIRDKDFKWKINGEVYPRTLAFLAELNRLAREHDKGAHE